MQIGDIVKLTNSRLNIPKTLMREAGIEPNSEAFVYMEVGEDCIIIRSKQKYDELKKRLLAVGFHAPAGLFGNFENNDDKIKVVEEKE